MDSKSLRVGLVALDLFMAVQGIAGGVGFAFGISGAPPELLSGTPFSSFFIPGMLLLLTVGGFSLVAGVLTIRDSFAGAAASVFAGCVVLGWIVGELYVVSWTHWLQPLEAGIGLLTIAFGSMLAADPVRLRSFRHPWSHAA
jgi:hypothetical protein